jgi:hypothetical protein
VLYALSTAAVVYLHLYGALVPVAQAIFAVGWLTVRRDWRAFGRRALASVAALVLFAPWLPHALGIFAFQGWREGGNATELPWRYLAAYTISDGLQGDWRAWLPWGYVVLAVALFFTYRTEELVLRGYDPFFLIFSGSVVVSKPVTGRVEQVLNRLGQGEVFGEMALLDRAPRTATVRAVRAGHVLRIGGDAFQQMLARSPSAALDILRTVSQPRRLA